MADDLAHVDDAQRLHGLRESGDSGRLAFVALYRRHLPMLLGMLARLDRSLTLQDREDLAQQAFAELWRNQGHFRGDCSAGHYLVRIAANLLSIHHREEARRKRREEAGGLDASVTEQDESLRRREAVELVHHALNQLPDAQREAVKLVCLEGRSIAEAAQIAGCTRKSMEHRYRRGKALLEQHLRDLA